MLHAPVPAVHPARAVPAAVGLQAAAGPPRRVLLVSGQAPDPAVAEVARLAGAREFAAVDAEADLGTRYGTDRGAELAALPDDVRALLPQPSSLLPCPTCDLLLPREVCPFCHTSRQPLAVGESL